MTVDRGCGRLPFDKLRDRSRPYGWKQVKVATARCGSLVGAIINRPPGMKACSNIVWQNHGRNIFPIYPGGGIEVGESPYNPLMFEREARVLEMPYVMPDYPNYIK